MKKNRLIAQYFEGTLPQENWQELSEFLTQSLDARREFRKMAILDDKLRTDSLSPAIPLPTTRITPTVWNKTPWVIAVACLVVAFILIFQNSQDSHSESQHYTDIDSNQDDSQNVIATLLNFENPIFGEQRTTADKDFNIGKYELKSGSIHLRFKSAVDFIFKGPGSFEILGSKSLFIEKGEVRTMVLNEEGHEFTILTPSSKFIDWGTEFCLSINPGRKDKIDVLSGLVEIQDAETSKSICHVKRNNFVTKQSEHWEGEFFQSNYIQIPSMMGGTRKIQRMNSYSRQSDILATFDFSTTHWRGKNSQSGVSADIKSKLPEQYNSIKDKIHGNRYIINKTAKSPFSHGVRHLGDWGPGRWGNTKALSLHDSDSHVIIDIDGKLKNLSFHTWLKIGNCEMANSLIFGSPTWDKEGDFLLEFTRSKRKPFLSFWGQSEMDYKKDVQTHLDFEWNLIALTIEDIGTSLNCKLYLNNQLITEQQTHGLDYIKPDRIILGNMQGNQGFAPYFIRPLKADIDEFIIWNRVLSEKDIQNLYSQGKPFQHYLTSTTSEL